MSDLISKEVAIDMLKAVRDLVWDVDIPSPTVPEYIEHHEQMQSIMRNIDILTDKIIKMPSAEPEPLTDKEQRIFLAAMEREEKVCEEVDRNYAREPYDDSLMRVCKEIRRKVKGALWT